MKMMMGAGDFENSSSSDWNFSSMRKRAEQVFYISTTEFTNRETDSLTEYHNLSDQVNLLGQSNIGGTIGFGIPDSPAAITVVNYCFGIILIIIGITGTSGNALVLYVFTR
ncbi:unnamed protein product [Allacma fusca]|uniref:Uncharacterized protein n=1 Tax=Allacma fusca TaxID=39272 RepID=A0A8J2KJY4_9HEXA|nr:unnamed protein product [Allacma fusca]